MENLELCLKKLEDENMSTMYNQMADGDGGCHNQNGFRRGNPRRSDLQQY